MINMIKCCIFTSSSESLLKKNKPDPIAIRKEKIVCNFGLSECKRAKKTLMNWK